MCFSIVDNFCLLCATSINAERKAEDIFSLFSFYALSTHDPISFTLSTTIMDK